MYPSTAYLQGDAVLGISQQPSGVSGEFDQINRQLVVVTIPVHPHFRSVGDADLRWTIQFLR